MPEIFPQVFIESNGTHRNGEKIVDSEDRGETGWVDWTGDYLARDGIKTARLFKGTTIR